MGGRLLSVRRAVRGRCEVGNACGQGQPATAAAVQRGLAAIMHVCRAKAHRQAQTRASPSRGSAAAAARRAGGRCGEPASAAAYGAGVRARLFCTVQVFVHRAAAAQARSGRPAVPRIAKPTRVCAVRTAPRPPAPRPLAVCVSRPSHRHSSQHTSAACASALVSRRIKETLLAHLFLGPERRALQLTKLILFSARCLLSVCPC